MQKVYDIHKEEYGIEPSVVVTAPGRFHLVGEHSWFFKDKTLSMAVNFPVYVSVSKREDTALHFYFRQIDDRKKSNLSSLKFKKEDRWANAIKSIVYGFTSGGFELGGVDFTVYSETLPSAGFGITTAIKVASALALQKLFDLKCEDYKILQVIERANRKFLNQENHIADNYACLFSQADSFIVTDYSKNSYKNFKIPFEDKTILLVDLSVPRFSLWNEESLFEPENVLILGDLRETKSNVFGGWQYINDPNDINEALTVLGEDTKRKLMCILREHSDVLGIIKSLEKNDFSKFARSVNHSYESLRDYYNLSCPEIDWVLKRVSEIEPNLESMRDPVSCGRITGKGFGRCVYTVLRNTDVEKFKEKLAEYEHIFGFTPKCYEVKSAEGAHVL